MFQELRRRASVRPDPVADLHFRDLDDFEVDIVPKGDGVVAAVEADVASTVHDSDLRNLLRLRGAAGERAGGRFVAGFVLYDRSATINFGDALFAVPIRTLWEEP